MRARQGRRVDLQGLLHLAGNVIVFLANDTGVQHAAGGVQGVHSRVNAQLCNAPGQHGGGIQVGKSCGWRRVCQIIGRNVDGLRRGKRCSSFERAQVGFKKWKPQIACCLRGSCTFWMMTLCRSS